MLLIRSLIQGRFEFPEIPQNLPGLLAVSLTTSGAAKGITSVRSPKGAAAIQPGLSDFITVGGVVSAERFQFFVRTVVGVLSFLFTHHRAQPGGVSRGAKHPHRAFSTSWE
jgi:hypothetical protein